VIVRRTRFEVVAMGTLRYFSPGILMAILLGCQSTATPVAPSTPGNGSGGACKPSSDALTICVRVPSGEPVSSIAITDSLYGVAFLNGQKRLNPSQCPTKNGEHVCVVTFDAHLAVNQIQVEATSATGGKRTGVFPVSVDKGGAIATAVVGGTVASISIVPFLSTIDRLGATSTLPLGQNEKVWIIGRDAQDSIIIGAYRPQISVGPSSPLTVLPGSPRTLKSSAASDKVTVSWAYAFLGNAEGKLAARAAGVPSVTSVIKPTSGVVYFTTGSNRLGVGPGPVAIASDGKVYFIISDSRGCATPGKCIGAIGRIDPNDPLHPQFVQLPSVPGVNQMYFTSDGALWMASYQPVGNWSGALPVLRMPPGQFSEGALQSLPDSFGQASGFFEPQGSGKLWISGCTGTRCSVDHGGTPVTLETSIGGPHNAPEKIVDLPLRCTRFGYLGFSVGDVSEFGGSLYVIGLNDGSPPPARGTVWRISPTSLSARCVGGLPTDFNPSPYFAQANGLLIFGIGGNSFNVQWNPSNGFYAINKNGALQSQDITPKGTATHLSVYQHLVYYIANGQRNIRVYGLGSYTPSLASHQLQGLWNVFPSALFVGAQLNNGVAASPDGNGAWYTAQNVCGSWRGVCLGRAIYLGAAAWSAVPQLQLPPLAISATTNFGVLANPAQVHSSPSPAPLNVHGGPFVIFNRTPATCNVNYTHPPQTLTFVATGLATGPCLIEITGLQQTRYLVTQVGQ
jgi:hypothetical protein